MTNTTNIPLDLPPDPAQVRRQRRIAWTLVALGIACAVMGGLIYGGRLLVDWVGDRVPAAGPSSNVVIEAGELVIAVSPAMKPTFDRLVTAFDTQVAEEDLLPIRTLDLNPEKMVEQSLEAIPPFQALTPDSGLWLHQLEGKWGATVEESEDAVIPLAQRRTNTPVRYAVTPIVIAAWESVARDLSWPYESVGWQQVQRKATEDPDFKWNHPSTNNASGLLATLAEFYAGAGLTRGLTEEAATDPATLEYVRDVESTIRFYGEGEAAILERLRSEGRSFLDAFVAQEQTVIAWNQEQPADRLVAIYPAEGTLWADHPLALLELDTLSESQRKTYQAFAAFLTGSQAQQLLLSEGYRPADLAISLDGPGSPFANTDAVDWRQPQTTLQMPAQSVVEVVQNVWWYTKRPTNVVLVVDTSGSMEDGNKMQATQQALLAFLDNIRGDRDRVALVEFGSEIKRVEPLQPLTVEGRDYLEKVIQRLRPLGNTAMLDGVWEAHQQILRENDSEAINAIIVMSDGLENASVRTNHELRRAFEDNESRQVVVFTIGFGNNADVKMLQEVALIGGGQFRSADETDIEELYRIISTYF